ncbi:MAG TPA: F0F1 ATP synthase subunit delta [Steroidobacteraceae bacterium]|nr:F0F1 ATP synthase subunit delta [Steroidobacteraceae bacterium]
MADKSTIARPYAKAAFEVARDRGKLGPWSEALRVCAAVISDPRVEPLLGNPRVTPEELATMIVEIAGAKLDEEGRNFVRTLADNHRLAVLPEIAARFDELKAEEEGVVDVTVTSAAPLDESQRGSLAAALERRLKRSVRLQCNTDPALIGGAVLRAGDMVIDGSLRGKLERIAYELAG